MQMREGEQEWNEWNVQRRRRCYEAEIAYREYVTTHAYDIGLTEGRIERIHFAQRLLKQPHTPLEELRRLSLADLAAIADQLERQLLPPDDAS